MRFTPRSMAFCSLFATLLMMGAMIRIPVPYVPFTLQTLFVFLCGLVLGPKLGFWAAVLYMTAGLIGLPVFTNGGGFMYVLQPSFGYILSFCPAASLIGFLSRRRPKSGIGYLSLCCFSGLLIIYIIGVFYYGMIVTLHLQKSITLWRLCYTGALIFLPGDALGCILAGWIFKRLPLISRFSQE